MLLHLAGPHVPEIFSKLVNTGKANNYISSIEWTFSSQSQLSFCASEISPTPTKGRWDCFAVCNWIKKRRKILQFWLWQPDKRPCRVQRLVRLPVCKPQVIWRKARANACLHVRTPRTVWRGRASHISVSKQGTEDPNRVHEKPGRPNGKQKSKGNKQEKHCNSCGSSEHLGGDPKCLAGGQTCRKCIGKDHFATVCKTKPKNLGVQWVQEELLANRDQVHLLLSESVMRSTLSCLCVG